MHNFKFIRLFLIARLFIIKDFEDDGEDESEGGWQQELQRRYAQEANFMAELRARHPTSPPDMPMQNHHQMPFPNYHLQQGQNFAYTQQNHSQGQNYAQQQHFVSQNQGPFGPQVGSPF